MPRRTRAPKSEPARRMLRTLFQVGTVTLLIQGYNVFVEPDLTAEQVSWLTAFGTMLVSFGQNALEDANVVPKMLKGPGPAPVEGLTTEEIAAIRSALASRPAEPAPMRRRDAV